MHKLCKVLTKQVSNDTNFRVNYGRSTCLSVHTRHLCNAICGWRTTTFSPSPCSCRPSVRIRDAPTTIFQTNLGATDVAIYLRLPRMPTTSGYHFGSDCLTEYANFSRTATGDWSSHPGIRQPRCSDSLTPSRHIPVGASHLARP